MSPRNGPLEELSRASETTAVGRSYVAEADGGAAYLRNRRYIKASTGTARRNVVGAPMVDVYQGVRFQLTVQFE